ncbi:MAG: hypothetical protein HYZ42_18460, partial [Bacteroidetes bacterium]|nr:hypothetical protein [Bacteroidota bacterium]
MKTLKFLVSVLVLCLFFSFCSTNNNPENITIHKTCEDTTDQYQVLSVSRYSDNDTMFYPDDYIVFTTNDTTFKAFKNNYKDSLKLYISGICFADIKPLQSISKKNGFIFQVKYDTSANSPWKILYAYPYLHRYDKGLNVNLGTRA